MEIVFNNLELALQNPKTTGMNAHIVPGLQTYFKNLKTMYEKEDSKQKFFKELHSQNPLEYENISHHILIAINKFDLKI